MVRLFLHVLRLIYFTKLIRLNSVRVFFIISYIKTEGCHPGQASLLFTLSLQFVTDVIEAAVKVIILTQPAAIKF